MMVEDDDQNVPNKQATIVANVNRQKIIKNGMKSKSFKDIPLWES